MDYIEEYLKKWNEAKIGAYDPMHETLKNDPKFIDAFISYCEDETTEWRFDGENGYCGFTAEIGPMSSWRGPEFEFAYGKGFVKVFTARNGGYWVPEYINLKGEEARTLLSILKAKLLEFGGF